MNTFHVRHVIETDRWKALAEASATGNSQALAEAIVLLDQALYAQYCIGDHVIV